MPKLLRQEPGGVGEYYHPDTGLLEKYCSTCSHCQKHTEFISRRSMFDHVDVCRSCMKLICLNCVGKACLPYEKFADRQESEAYLRAAIERSRWGCY